MTWLVKTEPGGYSWSDLVREKRTVWDGVRNPVALKHIAAMRKGDVVLVYHTGGEKAAVGIASVAKAPYPDPQQSDPRRLVVDLVAGKPLPRPVRLSEIRALPVFADSPLVRQGRLSVVPLTTAQWQAIERLARQEGSP